MEVDLCALLQIAHLGLLQQFNAGLIVLLSGVESGGIDPNKLQADKCWPAFVHYLNNDLLADTYNAKRIFADQFPEFANQFVPSDQLVAVDDDHQQLVGRARSRPHVAMPIVQVETKLPPDLAHLIGQFNSTCETITQEGKYCGMGDGHPFIYKLPTDASNGYVDTNAFVDCQSECTGDLCINWLTQLLSNLPKVVDLQFYPATSVRSPYYQSRSSSSSSTGFVDLKSGASIEEMALRIPILYCTFDIEGTYWSYTGFPGRARSGLAPQLLQAGCHLLNSGRNNVIAITMKLGPLDPGDLLARGMLREFTKYSSQGQVLTKFPEFVNNPTSSSGENYLSSTLGWKVEEVPVETGELAEFRIKMRLRVDDIKTRQETLKQMNEAEESDRKMKKQMEATASIFRNLSKEQAVQLWSNVRTRHPELFSEFVPQ